MNANFNNEGEFEKMFKEYFEYLFRSAFMYLKDEHSARDVVQELFEDIWKRRENIIIKQSVKAYLTGGIKFKCLSILRKMKGYTNDLEEGRAKDKNLDLITKEKVTKIEIMRNSPIVTAVFGSYSQFGVVIIEIEEERLYKKLLKLNK